MSERSLSQQDVYRALLQLLDSDAYPAGAKLPSCRALATEFGSNPNTVNRALQALQEEGLVRSVPRSGTFVTGVAPVRSRADWVRDELTGLVDRALAAGVQPARLRHLLDHALAEVDAPVTVTFTECNEDDLREMADAIEHVSGLTLQPVLLDELEAAVARARPAVIAVPLFHLGDVRALNVGDIPVVEIPFVPDPASLVRLASLDRAVPVTVASRHPRGVDRVASIVRQYFGGQVEGRLLSTEDADLSDVEMLVYNNGSHLRASELASAPATIKLSVMLDGRSATSIRARIEDAAGRSERSDAGAVSALGS